MNISRIATALLSLAIVLATVCCALPAAAGESVTVDWDVVQRAVDAKAYGVNGPNMFDPNAANNATYLAGLSGITQKRGFIRLHGWGMVERSDSNNQYWLNADGSWNADKIRSALSGAAGAGLIPSIMINIPSGPGGGTDYQDVDSFVRAAASLVQIVNVDNHFGVTYWELPNEREAGFQSPGLTAGQAATLISACSRAMKAKDPSIKVGGPATAWINVDYIANVVAGCLGDIDFVSCHTYGGDGSASDAAIYDSAQAVQGAVASLRSRLTAISGGKYLPIYVDEHNFAWQGTGRIHTNKEAVYDAIVLSGVIAGGGDASMYWHDAGSSMGLMDEAFRPYYTATTFTMFSAWFQGSQVRSSSSNAAAVIAYATRSDTANALCVVNRSAGQQTVTMAYNGFTPTTVDRYQVSSAGFSGPNAIAWPSIVGSGLTVPENSVTFLIARPPPSAIAPVITAQPDNVTVAVGQTASFRVTATGTPAPGYQWQRNGTDIAGATTTTFTTASTTTADQGATFRCVVGNSAGSVTSADATLTVTSGSGGAIAINCGGGGVGAYIADAYVSGGTTTTNWTGAVDVSAVTSPAPATIYQSERYGASFTYTIPGLAVGGSYTARLHFSEDWHTAAGKRLQDVSINGARVLSSFDIFASAGAMHKAVIRQFTATADAAGRIVIAFTGVPTDVDDAAKVDGIEIAVNAWTNRDIGGPGLAGSVASVDDTITVTGSGVDIWNASDGFQFVAQPLTGDGTIVARVVSMQNTNAWAKAGVMIRAGTTAGAVHAFCCVTAGNGVAFQRRTVANAGSSHTAGSQSAAPRWVKLVRQGAVLSGYESADGTTWRLVGTTTISMANPVQIGLAVTSHDNSRLCIAMFDHVLVTPSGNG